MHILLSIIVCLYGHCIACLTSIYEFWLPLWYLHSVLCILFCRSLFVPLSFWPLYFLSVNLRVLTSSLSLWPLYFLSVNQRVLTTPLSLWPLYFMSVNLRVLTTSLSLWPLYFMSVNLWVLTTHLSLWPLYFLSVNLRVLTSSLSLWPLHFLSSVNLRVLTTPWVSFCFCVVFCRSILSVDQVLPVFQSTGSGYLFGFFNFLLSSISPTIVCSFVILGQCNFCPSTYGFWLPLWFLHFVLARIQVTVSYPIWRRWH